MTVSDFQRMLDFTIAQLGSAESLLLLSRHLDRLEGLTVGLEVAGLLDAAVYFSEKAHLFIVILVVQVGVSEIGKAALCGAFRLDFSGDRSFSLAYANTFLGQRLR